MGNFARSLGRVARRGAIALLILSAVLVVPAATRSHGPPVALAFYVYQFDELTGGVTPGFSADSSPSGITLGWDDHIWFTESADPGRIARINDDGSVSEFTGGAWPGFSANTQPSGITMGDGGGTVWFTEFHGPTGNVGPSQTGGRGGVGRVNADGTITEFIGGLTPGFSVASGPGGGATPGSIYQCPGIGLFSGGICPPDNTVWAPPAVSSPGGIFRGPDGTTWFTESAGRIGRVDGADHVSEITAGVTPGFTEGSIPSGLTLGEDDHMWFTEAWGPQGNVGPGRSGGRGGVGRINDDGSVDEYKGGLTTGFSVASYPQQIAQGTHGHRWFTEGYGPDGKGAVAEINDDGSATELIGGNTPGFSADSQPAGITISLGDGAMWFTESAGAGGFGGIGRVNEDGSSVYEFKPGIWPGLSPFAQPEQIVNGPDNGLWFTEAAAPGRIGHIRISEQQEHPLTQQDPGTPPSSTPAQQPNPQAQPSPTSP